MNENTARLRLSTPRYVIRYYACEAPITNPNTVTAHLSRPVRL